MEQLPILYGITGFFSIIFGPIIRKFSDRLGKYKVFVASTLLSSIIGAIYTHYDLTPLWRVVSISVVMFIGVTSRMISESDLMT